MNRKMSKYDEIFSYLSGCPQLKSLWSIWAEKANGANIILPQGTSARRTVNEFIDNTGAYNADIRPLPSVYEEYQINCYRYAAPNENSFNVLTLDEVQAICDWITEQDENGNLPAVTGKHAVSIEPFPFNPQIRFIDPDSGLVCYFITVRITYVNTARARTVEYNG